MGWRAPTRRWHRRGAGARYVVPESAAARSDAEREGYATIYDHYRMRPITVTSRDPDQIVPWEQIRNLISWYPLSYPYSDVLPPFSR